MELHIRIEGEKDLAGQLYRQLRDAILSGRLARGERMPPTRLLCQQLGMSRKTVSGVYEKLVFEKLLVGQVGIGTFVRGALPAAAPARPPTPAFGNAALKRWSESASFARHGRPEAHSRFEFIGGSVDKSPFPLETWNQCVKKALRQSGVDRGRYGPTEGLLELRQAVAHHIGFHRGVRCSEHDLIITNGAQQALDLIARVLIEPGTTVAVEEPGYPPARQLFASQGAKVIGIPVDAQGIVVDAIPEDCRLVYVTPSHQFPLGMPMSLPRRLALMEKAARIGAIIVEDDYDSAFRYDSRPIDSLQSMDQHGLVAYVGTFSKIMLPEIRIGYIVAPPAIFDAVLGAKRLSSWHTPTLIERGLANFIDAGHLHKHIRRCRDAYLGRHDRLMHHLNRTLSPWLEPIPISAGLHLTATLTTDVDLALLLRLARRFEVGLYSNDGFYHYSKPVRSLFFGFGAIDTLNIDQALERVQQVFQELSS